MREALEAREKTMGEWCRHDEEGNDQEMAMDPRMDPGEAKLMELW